MKINILTLYPDMFPGSLGFSLAGKALTEGKWSYKCINIRDFATDAYKSVDDTPFGGGAGMVMRATEIDAALKSIYPEGPFPASKTSFKRQMEGTSERRSKVYTNVHEDSSTEATVQLPLENDFSGRDIYYLSPRGQTFNQTKAIEFAHADELTFICGRFEGIDQRVLDKWNIREISIGDFVLSGGEPALITMLDAAIRLIPSVMGNAESMADESFSNGLLEYPHYTKPAVWDGRAVPEVLISGHHANIQKWRREQSEQITKTNRPDLWDTYQKQVQQPKKG